MLFQSWGQFISYIVCVVLILLIAKVVLNVAGGRLTYEPMIGAFLGALVAVQITQQCVFTVNANYLTDIERAIESRLSRAGFILEPSTNAYIAHYRSKLPRWLTFKENDVYVHRGEATIAIYGPRYIVKPLHKVVARTMA
jgi:hypothetical protein